MAIIKLTNGFPTLTGLGDILSGTLIEGTVIPNEQLILDDKVRVPILETELDEVTFPGTVIIRITVPRNLEVVWHKYYGKNINIE